MTESTVLLETLDEPKKLPVGDADPEVGVEVRRNNLVSGVLGALASAVAIAYLARALGSGGDAGDWLICLALAGVGAGYLVSFADARTPLLVADERGVRIRLGRTWCGLAWAELDEIEHTPRFGWRDGRLVLVPVDEDGAVAKLSVAARRQTLVNRRLYGAPFAVPLALTTRLAGIKGSELTAALLGLAGDVTTVVEVDRSLPDYVPDEAALPTPTPTTVPAADGEVFDQAALGDDTADQPAVIDGPAPEPEPAPEPSPAPGPLRNLMRARRSDIARESAAETATVGANALRLDRSDGRRRRVGLPELGQLRRSDPELEETITWSVDTSSSIPATVAAAVPETVVVPDLDALLPQPAPEPVVGPVLAIARTRIGLGVDQLAERTRIRPHVIEAIEVDDFAPCGGDFYARGHLRTLARVLGVEAGPLITEYDARYADAPIDARRVFEAELATGAGGSIRGTRGGPNWSVLVAAAMAFVLLWSIARIVMDGSTSITPAATGIAGGSGGPTDPYGAAAPPVPVTVSAPAGGARLTVRNGSGKVIFNDQVQFGGSRTLKVSLPMRVYTTDGSVRITVDGHDEGPMGVTGQPAQKTYTAPS